MTGNGITICTVLADGHRVMNSALELVGAATARGNKTNALKSDEFIGT